MTIVPDAFALLRELIPNAAASLYLRVDGGELGGAQLPQEMAGAALGGGSQRGEACAPAAPALERVGTSAHPTNSAEEIEQANALPPPNGYFFSDSSSFAPPRPEQYRHRIEHRLQSGGEQLGSVTLFRDEEDFDRYDAEDLGRLANYFEHAIRHASAPAAGLSGIIEDEAMLLATQGGEILYLSDSAGALLDQLASQEQQVFDRKMLPPFCQRLVESVVYGDSYPWRLPSCTLAIAGGALEARAQWMSAGGVSVAAALQSSHTRTVGIFLKFVVPMPLRIWRALNTVELSPQQMEVAYWMGVGGGREAARAKMDVSDAVLRDCVKVVYEKFGCTSEAGLLAMLRPVVSRM